MTPLKFSESFKEDELDAKVIQLTNPTAIEEAIKSSKLESLKALSAGILLIILSLMTSCWLAYVIQRDQDLTHFHSAKSINIDNKSTLPYPQSTTPNDYSLIGLIILVAFGFAGGIIALRSYRISLVNTRSLRNVLLLLHDVQLAWQISKSLPEWSEKEPQRTVREWENGNPRKEEIKGMEWLYPQHRARQQIIEVLLSGKQ